MPQTPIGVTFLPSADNQQTGPQQGALEGPPGDLGQAFKILSLHLPRVMGAQAPASDTLLRSRGASGVQAGFNPTAAVFQALLKQLLSGGGGTGDTHVSYGIAPPTQGVSTPLAPSAAPKPPTLPSAPSPRPAPSATAPAPFVGYQPPSARTIFDGPPMVEPSTPDQPFFREPTRVTRGGY